MSQIYYDTTNLPSGMTYKNPKAWGKQYWDRFFQVAASYPMNPTYHDKQRYKKFYAYYLTSLPCSICNVSYQKFWNQLNIDNYLSSRKHLLYWVFELKNKVNDKLRAQGEVIRYTTFEKVYNRYV
ncbi:MAG: ERV1/ALR-related protein [Clostridium sp.]